MDNKLSIFTFTISLLTLVACSPHKKQESGVLTLNSGAIASDASLTPLQKAERLSRAAEKLVTPNGFMYADLVFEQALSFDPNNKRAQFYRALLATPMSLKGVLARAKPLADSHPKTKKEFDEAIAQLPAGGLRSFLFDGTGEIRTERDLQELFSHIYQTQRQFRNFLKEHKSLELTLNVKKWPSQGSIESVLNGCAVTVPSDGVYEISQCELIREIEVKLNRADIETLQQIAAGSQIQLSVLTAYDLTGSFGAARKFEDQKVSNRVLYQELAKNSDFAKLKNAEVLQDIMNMGVDAVAGFRWAMEMQNELCPLGEENVENRKGFLFAKGLCIHSSNESASKIDRVLKMTDAVLSRQTIELKMEKNKDINTVVKPSAFLENPIADLKTLRPVINKCDKVQSVSDGTLGGLFPRHDFNDILASGSECGY